MAQFRYLIPIFLIFSHSLWADDIHPLLNCQLLLGSSHANQVEISTKFAHGAEDEILGVAYASVSQQELIELINRGSLDRVDVYPFQENALIQSLHQSHPNLRTALAPAKDQFGVAAIEAWTKTVLNLVMTRAKIRPTLFAANLDFLVELISDLRPLNGSKPFSPRFSEIRSAISSVAVEPNDLRPLVYREPTADQADDTSLVFQERRRKVAEILNIPWGAGGKTMRAFEAVFANLPANAGVVISLKAKAASKIAWGQDEFPFVKDLSLSDIEGIEPNGDAEFNFLDSLPKH